MKSIVKRTVFVLIFTFLLSLPFSILAAPSITVTPSTSKPTAGTTMSLSYNVTGSSGQCSIAYKVYYYVGRTTNVGTIVTELGSEEYLDPLKGSVQFTVPQDASTIYYEFYVYDKDHSYCFLQRENEYDHSLDIPVTGYLQPTNPIDVSYTFDRNQATAGGTITGSWKVTGGIAPYQVHWSYLYLDDGYMLTTLDSGNTTVSKETKTLTVPQNAKSMWINVWVTDSKNVEYSSESRSISVVVEDSIPVKITTNPESQAVAYGNFVDFHVSASGSGLTYQWQYKSPSGNWTNCTEYERNMDTMSVQGSDDNNGYQYRCIVKNPAGASVTSAAATLTVTNLAIGIHPYDQTCSAGDTAEFWINASGSGLTYQWQFKTPNGDWKNSPASGNTTDTLLVPATMDRNGYLYRCIVKDYAGSELTSRPAELIVERLAFLRGPISESFAVGMNATFRVSINGTGLTYQWQYMAPFGEWTNSSENGNTTSILTVPVTKDLDGYKYRCTVKDQYGNSATSSSALLMVESVLTIIEQPKSQTVTVGANVEFTVGTTGAGNDYQWQYKNPSGNWTNSLANGNKTYKLEIPATTDRNGNQYRCIVKDDYGNTAISNVATLTISELLITSHPENQISGTGSTVSFNVSANGKGLTYQWRYKTLSGSWVNSPAIGNNTNTLSVPATADRNGYQYCCVVKDQYGNTVTSNAATLTVTSGLSITTQPTAKTVKAGTNASFKVAASGDGLTYQWQYRTSSTGTWANTTATGCKTATLTVTTTVAKNGYQYRCVVKDKNGATVNSNAATLTVTSGLSITTQPAAKTVKAGTNASFKVAASGDGLTYQWQFRTSSAGTWTNTTATGCKTATLTVTTTVAKNGYQYRCIVKDKYGASVTSNGATLTVDPVLSIATQPASKTANNGTNATFTVAAKGAGLTYQWQFRTSSTAAWKNTTATGCKTASLTVAVTATKNGYQYRCIVKDKYGASVTSDTATLTASKPAKITAQPVNKTVLAGTDTKFTVTASGDGLTYQWQFRKSSVGTWANTTATGCKTATLTVAVTAAKNGYQYRCIVKDKYGASVISNMATLTVQKPLKITVQPVDKTETAGIDVKFTVTASGDGLTYQWQFRKSSVGTWANTTATGNKTATLTVPVTASRNGYQYRCIVKDSHGASVTSKEATLTVQ